MRITRMAMITVIVLLLAGGCAQQPAYEHESIGDALQTMKGIIEPTSNALFRVGLEEPKLEEPQDDERWAAVKGSALTLADSGNLLLLGDRAKGKDADWSEQSQADGCPPQPVYEPVGDMLQIMKGIIEPTSNVLFRVGAEEPQDDKQWAAVEGSALTLAESGNLLLLGDRAKGKDADWTEQSLALVQAGKLAFQAARDKDVDRLLEIGEPILETCLVCHKQYLPGGGI